MKKLILLVLITLVSVQLQAQVILKVGPGNYNVTIDGRAYVRGYLGSAYTYVGNDTLLAINVNSGFPKPFYLPKKSTSYLDGDNHNIPFASARVLKTWMDAHFESNSPLGDSLRYATNYDVDTAKKNIRASINDSMQRLHYLTIVDSSANITNQTFAVYTPVDTATYRIGGYIKLLTGSCLTTFKLNWTDAQGDIQRHDWQTNLELSTAGILYPFPDLDIRVAGGTAITITTSTAVCTAHTIFGWNLVKVIN